MIARSARKTMAAALLVAVIAASGCVILPRRAFPKTGGSVTVEGLQAPVEIIRDRYGVPHIYGRSAADLYFAQGYVHAQDRFWQMEFSRRVGAGRLSELFGEDLLDTDIFLRTLGFHRVAAEEYALLDPETRGYVDAYVAGVNAYIRDRKPGKIALEYSLLKLSGADFEVEEWTAENSLTWAKMMAWDLGGNMSVERLLLDLLRTAGVPGVAELFAPYRPDMPLVISDEEAGLSGERPPADQIFPPSFVGKDGSGGTNSWVISGDLTATGKPILANDTHLGVQMPSIWYEIGLHTVDEEGRPSDSADAVNVRGFSFPGDPTVVIGHNSRIAWGISDFPDDVQDLYFERINPLDPNQYEVNGEWRDMELSHERIDIQGRREPFVHVVRRTRHGPIISDRGGYKALESYGYAPDREFPANLELTALALRWTALEPGQLLVSLARLDRARDFREFREALRLWNGPVQNFVYADAEGNIGYQTGGWIPVRTTGAGHIPVPGWTDAYEWTGRVPYDELPSILNPRKGYIVSANNLVVSANYPHYLGSDATYGYRARRIVDMIEEAGGGISVDAVRKMQGDTLDSAALEIVSRLEGLDLEAEVISEYLREKEAGKEKVRKKRVKLDAQVEEALETARRMLLDWDGRMDMESAAAALYGFFFLELIEETFRDQYPADRWAAVNHARVQNTLHFILEEPENFWWDDVRTPDVHEKRDDILVRAFRDGLEAGIDRLGEKLEKWEWGEVHRTEFRNASLGESGVKFIEKLFNRGPVATSGGSTTVTVAKWDMEEPFDVFHIPAMRQIIDLGNLDAGLMIHAPGQSGHPRHRHYDDFIEPWRKIEYHPSLWSREAAEEERASRLVLKPAPQE